MWATSPRLRPYMAPLYRDLRSAAGTLKLIRPKPWQNFLDALDDSAKVAKQLAGLWLPFKAQVIQAGSDCAKQSKPPQGHIRAERSGSASQTQRAQLRLRNESKEAPEWLRACFAHDRRRSVRQKPMLHCFAAVDARADGDIIGVGGWTVTARHCAWFAEQWTSAEIRTVWPQLTETPQRYIARFETLAQLALAMTAHCALGAQQWAFCLPAASDTAAAEAQTEKLWSTAEPLGSFLILTAAWAAKHHVELHVIHIAGEQNTWADDLSRGKLARFRHRTAERATGCITLHPPHAAWCDSLSAAQLPTREGL